jgi:ketosteroid isomerase-like protein
MGATTTRTPQEVFQHHGETLVAGDPDGIVSDYSDDAIIISPDGVLRGKDGVRKAFEKLLADLPSADWELLTTHFEDDILFLEWKATSEETKAGTGSTRSSSGTV